MSNWLFKNMLFRNLLVYTLFLVIIAAVNFSGIMEVMNENSIYLFEFLGFYTFSYLLCLLHNRMLYERFLNKKRYAVYSFVLFISVLFWAFVVEYGQPFSIENLLNSFVGGFLVLFFGFGIYIFFKTVFLEQLKLQIHLTNTRNELVQLRAQLNPHFLFNALNNLYGVSISEPNKISTYILMLSDLLRYQVDGSKKERVSLLDELRFIEQFVAYEKLKLGHRGVIALQIHVPTTDLVIAPLVLFQFVENAFKFSGQKAEPMVDIRVSLKGKRLFFECTNSYDLEHAKSGSGTQTGLLNVMQRLELQYPLKHSLLIDKLNSIYSVKLEINLLNGYT